MNYPAPDIFRHPNTLTERNTSRQSAFLLDVHTHSIASGHYTSDTVTDMARAAASKGMKLLGISEHGPALPCACTLSYFRGLSHAPSVRMGVRILYGAEVNILDASGSLDLPEDIREQLDYCLAGIHPPCFNAPQSTDYTDAYIRAMANPHIHIIAHPDDARYPVDYRRLTEAAMDYHVLLEINNASLSPDGYRGAAAENDRTILELCKKYRYPVLLSSDSHGHSNIGNFKYALDLVRETAFPAELILNTSADRFLRFL